MLEKQIINLPINTSYTYYFYLHIYPYYNSAENTNLALSKTIEFPPATGITFSTGGIQVSQNGASFVNTTNLPTEIGLGWYSLVLTSAEMNYKDILLYIQSVTQDPSDSTSFFDQVWLCTTSVGGSLSLATTISELSSIPSVGDTLGNKIQAIFQYLFNKRTVTTSQEKLYKSDNSTVLGTGTLSDDGTTFTKGSPS